MTSSPNFPTLNALQSALAGFTDGFVAKLNAAGNALVYSTYVGASGDDEAKDLAIDAGGNAHVTGWTTAADFPVNNAVQSASGGADDGWVSKLSPSGASRLYSTYIGGTGYDYPVGIAVDRSNNIYVMGETTSTDFPTLGALQGTSGGDIDAFVAKIADDATPPPPPPPPPAPAERFTGGGQRTDVNEFLTYTSPTEAETRLPAGTKTFDVHIYYGKTIKTSTFSGELNGWTFTGFKPEAGSDQVVTVPLNRGRNVLVFQVDGIRSDGKRGTDKDRLVLIVP